MPAKRQLTVIIERDEDGFYVGSVPELPGCHTQASTLDELMERVKEAALLCLEHGGVTELPPLEFVGVQRIEV